MPVPKALATMAIPTVISQLINLVYNIVDTYFIGRTGNSDMVAAVTLAFTLFMMTIAFSNLFGTGGGSLMARLIGRGKPEEAKKVCAFSFYGAAVVAVAYSIVVLLLLEPILTLFGASENTMGFAKQYVWLVVIIGNLPVILSLTLSHLLRNTGYSKQASTGLSIGGVLNILLDPLLMFVLLPDGMEVFGAALATMLSNVVSFVYLLIVLLRLSKKKDAPLGLKLSDAKAVARDELKELFSVGVPSAILTGLFDVANVFLNALMAKHGDPQLAAVGIVMKAERLPNAINLGVCQGMLPIVAYNYSSDNHKRMSSVISTARLWGLVIAAVSIVLFELCASPLLSIFMNTSPEMTAEGVEKAAATIAFGVEFIRLRALASPFQFLNYHTSFCMQAMGDGKGTLVHAVFRELIFYIPLMYLLNALFGQNGLASAMIFGEALGAAFALILLRVWMKRKTNR